MEFFIWVETRNAGRTADTQQIAMVGRSASRHKGGGGDWTLVS